ncbi:MAG TPA: chromosome segregation protein SMC [Candidatus Binataceae bacterium]|nr:chromosome segregation protein SMC [Candidatus Binataceae bacterium]
MRLKSLELVGFKSFFDPTAITFSPGVTAVVGPNGCGKSNVVDAIRWVLGEQAPTRLRGKSAEDLIYAGNDSNAASGMAEVSLLLEAEEGAVFPEPYAALSEVAVTRRVYRSGDSEYLLNRIPCRLKDITEFFMAVQIHSRGYALIEQGRIEEIIQAKPHELRAMVEEAAGLSLFKGRREMSERKLERVKENLARVDDVLNEIERQLNYARRQAKKAEAFRLIRTELIELERLTAARRLFDQRSSFERHSIREGELRIRIDAGRAAVSSAQDSADSITATLTIARTDLAAARRELENFRAAFDERARTQSFIERRITAITELEPDLTARLADLENRATASRASHAETGARYARELNRGDGGSETAVQRLRDELRTAEQAQRTSERHTEQLKDELSDLIREAAVIRGRLADLSGERSDCQQRLHAFALEAPGLAAILEQAQAAADAADAALAAARDESARLDAIVRETAGREIETRAAMDHQASRITAARADLSAAHTRAQRIMPHAASEKLNLVLESLNGDRPPVTPALLLDAVKAPPALEPALRAVLGETLDGVIAPSSEFALRAVEILKRREGGRLSFIPEAIAPASSHAPLDAPGILGRLLDMVQVEPRFDQLAQAVIGHVVVSENLESALAASNLNGYGTVFVTPDGDLFWPGRVISGGSGPHNADLAAFAANFGANAVETAERALADAEQEHRELSSRHTETREAHHAALQAFEAARIAAEGQIRGASEARAAIGKAEQRIALANANHSNLERRLANCNEIVLSSNVRMEELAILEQQARTQLNQAANELAERRETARKLGESMRAAVSKAEARRATLNALQQELRHLERISAEVEAQIVQHRAQLERSRNERSDYQRELAKLAEQDYSAVAHRDELEVDVNGLATRCSDLEQEFNRAKTDLATARQTLAAAETEAVDCSLMRERARTLIEELERGFLEKFDADFSAVASDLALALSGRDQARDDDRLSELRARAEKIGEVNLAAESEVKELEERAATLDRERADLRAAVNDLSQTIHKLNREARERFAETFEGAAKNFSELFPKLLRGGKAHLELIAADDVLETGVTIMVQPAGKKVKEIGLLSGGEKALSAMALIFSLFLLNPSPFCIMDEVDAPLDEFSLAAFTSLIGELKQRSQFIVITHNQRTMQSADHIHGVTMERPGVSRIISLKIPQAA